MGDLGLLALLFFLRVTITLTALGSCISIVFNAIFSTVGSTRIRVSNCLLGRVSGILLPREELTWGWVIRAALRTAMSCYCWPNHSKVANSRHSITLPWSLRLTLICSQIRGHLVLRSFDTLNKGDQCHFSNFTD